MLLRLTQTRLQQYFKRISVLHSYNSAQITFEKSYLLYLQTFEYL